MHLKKNKTRKKSNYHYIKVPIFRRDLKPQKFNGDQMAPSDAVMGKQNTVHCGKHIVSMTFC